ncbi:leucine-rich repeat-containing protein 72-like [Labrus bergylta]|uniref:leucine-rich repeat-containing protein 72-like n=1 Tax=Labrus bergylta TaxID=56723 RepID=UPI0033141425
MDTDKDIQDSLQRCGVRRDVDVCRFILAKKKLTSVPDLSRFPFLRELWLNNNKIRELSCRSVNCCLTELYLHNNNIKSISGALNHLTCLRLLFLHNNQMRGLEDTMHELRRMQNLQTAKPGYRLHVIHCLPSVKVLDKKAVRSEERRRLFQIHMPQRHSVLRSVACCRKTK